MEKLIKKLKEMINDMTGNVLGINVKEKDIIDYIVGNNKICQFNLLSEKNKQNISSSKTKKKKVYVADLKNKFSVDYIICNYDSLKKYKKTLIKDSLVIAKKKVIFYTYDKENLELINDYKKYIVKTNLIQCIDGQIFVIDNRTLNKGVIAKLKYILNEIYNLIGDIMSS